MADEKKITMYGADWCGDCRRSKGYLDAHGVPYTYVDVDADAAAKEMIDENASTDQVGLGSTVEVTAERKTRTYMIVGSTEADPSGEPPKISNVSPLGASLLGKKIGEKVQVTLPNGESVAYTIKKIS